MRGNIVAPARHPAGVNIALRMIHRHEAAVPSPRRASYSRRESHKQRSRPTPARIRHGNRIKIARAPSFAFRSVSSITAESARRVPARRDLRHNAAKPLVEVVLRGHDRRKHLK